MRNKLTDLFRRIKPGNPANRSAQHLANLVGTSVAGFVPEVKRGTPVKGIPGNPILPKIDIDAELSRRKIILAPLFILSGLIKAEKPQRDEILTHLDPNDFQPKSFEKYLFKLIIEELRENGIVSISEIQIQIPEYGPIVWGEKSNEQSLKGEYLKWAQILDFNPTPSQINEAIKLQRISRKDN